jgi:hypothetical protein
VRVRREPFTYRTLRARVCCVTNQQSLAHEELSLSSVIENSLERALVSRFRDRIVACLKKPTKCVFSPPASRHDQRKPR